MTTAEDSVSASQQPVDRMRVPESGQIIRNERGPSFWNPQPRFKTVPWGRGVSAKSLHPDLKRFPGLARGALLLLLDEPTNHFDLPARIALEEALCAYPGAMVLVSHDAAFRRALGTTTWRLVAGDDTVEFINEI